MNGAPDSKPVNLEQKKKKTSLPPSVPMGVMVRHQGGCGKPSARVSEERSSVVSQGGEANEGYVEPDSNEPWGSYHVHNEAIIAVAEE
jgi:hypothetical protein